MAYMARCTTPTTRTIGHGLARGRFARAQRRAQALHRALRPRATRRAWCRKAWRCMYHGLVHVKAAGNIGQFFVVTAQLPQMTTTASHAFRYSYISDQ
eukprot:88755-Pleurochrysis_carterae.AAC.1